jgi:transposase
MSQILFNFDVHKQPKANSENNISSTCRKSIRAASRNQIEFTLACLDDLIPQDHRARDVWEYVSQLDLSCFHLDIKVLEGCGGPRTADPKILLAIWLFAILNGEYSARHITRLCREHHAYIWLCGGVTMNYHSLSDFRTQNAEKFRTLLQESIAIMWKNNIFNPEKVAQDGTRVKASAGGNSLKRGAKLAEYLKEANKYLNELEKELKENPSASSLREKAAKQRAARERKDKIERAQAELEEYRKTRADLAKKNHHKFSEEDSDNLKVSITDSECRTMKMGDQGFRPAFNVQFATSANKKVILGVSVVNTLDPGTLYPMMNQVKANLAAIGCPFPKKWLADSAYANKADAHLAEVNFQETTFYSPPPGNKVNDSLTARKADNPAMINLRKRMGTEEAQEIYRERFSTAEFSNAVAKNRGMREFLVRGISKVTSMSFLYAVVHNMSMYFTYN